MKKVRAMRLASRDGSQDLERVTGADRLGLVETEEHVAVEKQPVGFSQLPLAIVDEPLQRWIPFDQALQRGDQGHALPLDVAVVVDEPQQRSRESNRHPFPPWRRSLEGRDD